MTAANHRVSKIGADQGTAGASAESTAHGTPETSPSALTASAQGNGEARQVPFDVWLTFRRLDYRLALIHADLACDAANLHNSRARALRCYWRLLDEARADYRYRMGVQ